MSNNTNLIAFGTFGNPNGFKQTFFIGNNKNLARSVKTFDLKTDAIKLFPQSKVYSIRKDYANGFNTIAYTIYTFAKEKSSDRGGTFIGSSLLFTNKVADESTTIQWLNEFHNDLINKNIENDIISVSHSDHFSVSKPKGFDKVNDYKEVKDLNFVQYSNKNLVVYTEVKSGKLQLLFKKSVDLLNVYDSVFFTDSKDVAEFVYRKGIFKLVEYEGFEKEIEILEEDRKRKVQLSITEFEQEKENLEEDRKKLVEEYRRQIEHNEKLHQENERKIEESKVELSSLNQKYDTYNRLIEESINQPRSGRSYDDIRRLHIENRQIFIDSINQQKKPVFIHKVPKPNTRTDLKSSTPTKSWNDELEYDNTRHQNKEEKVDGFKVITYSLLLLLIGTLIYFLFFDNLDESVFAESIPKVVETSRNEKDVTKLPAVEDLTPNPNSELSINDYRLVAKKLEYETRTEDVVKIIFKYNPTEINSKYSNQADLYAKHLVERNKSCFEEKNGIIYFVKDTLKHIPSFKDK